MILSPVFYCLRGGGGFLSAALTGPEIDNAKTFFCNYHNSWRFCVPCGVLKHGKAHQHVKNFGPLYCYKSLGVMQRNKELSSVMSLIWLIITY